MHKNVFCGICRPVTMALVAWGGILAAVSQCSGADSGAPVPSVAEVTRAIETSRSRISSLWLVVQRYTIVDKGKTMTPPQEGSEVSFAFEGRRRFLRSKEHIAGMMVELETAKEGKKEISGEAAKALGIKDIAETTRVYDGTLFRVLRGNAAGEIHSLATLEANSGSNFDMFYLRCLGWFIEDPTAKGEFEALRQDRFVPNVFAHAPAPYTVSRETVDGMDCVRLDGSIISGHTPERDAMWLAPSRGYAIVRRQFSDNRGRLAYQISTSDFAEITAGCWLPRRCIINEYHSPDAIEATSRIVRQTELRLADWRVNDLDPAMFTLEFPSNAMVADFAKTHEWGLPLTKPIVRRPAADGRTLEETIDNVPSDQLPGGASNARIWLLWCNVIALVVLLALFCARRYRRYKR